LTTSRINSKKHYKIAKTESIYDINYNELGISGAEKEQLIKYESDIKYHREKTMIHIDFSFISHFFDCIGYC
jgi:hypothetical protein